MAALLGRQSDAAAPAPLAVLLLLRALVHALVFLLVIL
jgi:hypothetical protein